MSDGDLWEIDAPTTLDFDGPVDTLHLRLMDGALNVVRAAEPGGPVRMEISEVHGAPLRVRRKGGTLTVGYEDMSWDLFLDSPRRALRKRRAVVSLSVPADARLTAGVVSAATVVSGLDGPVEVRGVNCPVTLAGLSGEVDVRTVAGEVDAQSLGGSLRFHSASGDLTVLDGPPRVEAEAVSGRLMLDLADAVASPELRMNTVSGAVAVRFPGGAGAAVRANTVSGKLSSEFDGVSASRGFGPGKLTGTLGDGTGRVRITTVSGSVALLRRPTDQPMDAPGPAASLAKDI